MTVREPGQGRVDHGLTAVDPHGLLPEPDEIRDGASGAAPDVRSPAPGRLHGTIGGLPHRAATLALSSIFRK